MTVSKRNIFLVSVTIHSLITIAILGFFWSQPINVPFVDDWLLIPWGTGQIEYSWNNFWQMLNGHQHNLMKLYTIWLGHYQSLDLVLSTYIETVLGSIGFFLLIWSQIKNISLTTFEKIAAFAGLSLVCLTWRQMQNYFMLICMPWMMSIFAIGCYFYLKNTLSSKKNWLLSVVVVLSPMTFALGLIVPLSQGLESLFNIFEKKFKNAKLDIYFALVSLFSILLSFGYPTLTGNVFSANHSPLVGSSFFSVLHSPMDFPKFIFLAAGQPFVVWFSSAMSLGIGIGFLICSLLVFFVFRYRKNAAFILKNETSLLAGFIFLLMFFMARYKLVGVEGAIEPRYTTASIVFLVGALVTLLRLVRYKTTVAVFIFILGCYVHWRGILVGSSYYETRLGQTTEINKCFKENPNLEINMQNPCVKLLYPGEWLNGDDFLNWVKLMKERKLAFFMENN